jgi:hypothetical protein
MGNVTGLNVSPYLSSALSRIQANELAGTSKSPAQASSSKAAQTAGSDVTNVLSDRTLGALVAMQAEEA